jgi:hypothetical protein
LQNSIVISNVADTDSNCSVYGGAIVSGGYNLFAAGMGCVVALGDVIAPDARLDPLAYNGGVTPTHALWSDSPAFHAGNPGPPGSGNGACEPIDQRGIPRTRCDIGAYQRLSHFWYFTAH